MNELQKYPKISIVTVTYNAEQYLEQTIKSVIEQDYSNIEYIIIDGASKDNTIDIIKKYEKYITYWISEPDSGIYDAMNKGIDVATGEWINFMNAGDSFTNNILNKLFTIDVISNYDIIYGDRILISTEKKVIEKANSLENFYLMMPFGHQSTFIKSNILKTNKFDLLYTLSSDYDLLLNLYQNNYSFYYYPEPISHFILGGLSQQNSFKSNFEALHSIYKYNKNINNVRETVFFKQMMHNEKFKFIDELEYIDSKYNKIAIYGYSKLGKFLSKYFHKKTTVCFDSFIENYDNNYDIIHPSKIESYSFDIIIIALLSREQLIYDLLIKKYHIKKEKIITLDL